MANDRTDLQSLQQQINERQKARQNILNQLGQVSMQNLLQEAMRSNIVFSDIESDVMQLETMKQEYHALLKMRKQLEEARSEIKREYDQLKHQQESLQSILSHAESPAPLADFQRQTSPFYLMLAQKALFNVNVDDMKMYLQLVEEFPNTSKLKKKLEQDLTRLEKQGKPQQQSLKTILLKLDPASKQTLSPSERNDLDNWRTRHSDSLLTEYLWNLQHGTPTTSTKTESPTKTVYKDKLNKFLHSFQNYTDDPKQVQSDYIKLLGSFENLHFEPIEWKRIIKETDRLYALLMTKKHWVNQQSFGKEIVVLTQKLLDQIHQIHPLALYPLVAMCNEFIDALKGIYGDRKIRVDIDDDVAQRLDYAKKIIKEKQQEVHDLKFLRT